MTTLDIHQAREWAEWSKAVDQERPHTPATAAAEVILSLPDTVVDGDKLRKIYDLYRDSDITLHEAFREAVALIPAPAPRTLGDMSLEELKDYIEKKVTVDGWANPALLVAVIGDEGAVLAHRWNVQWPFVEVRPLTDLTPVAAPEQEPQPEHRPNLGPITLTPPTREEEAEVRNQFEEPTLPRPEDVPPGEPWSVRYWGKEWVGVRSDHHTEPWSIISMDGLDYRDVYDSEITLMFRLVPETP